MGRALRVVLLTAAILAGYLAVRGVTAWRAERRRKTVYPAEEAAALLHPARRLIMPVAKALQRFRIAPGQTVLEAGPGPGYYTVDAARIVGHEGRILCLDIQRGMLEFLRDRLDVEEIRNVDLVVADAQHLPLRTGAVDTAFLVTVLGEVPDPALAVAELRRVIKPGGSLGFSESFGDPDYVRAGTLRGLCSAAGFAEKGHWRDALGYTSRFVAPD